MSAQARGFDRPRRAHVAPKGSPAKTTDIASLNPDTPSSSNKVIPLGWSRLIDTRCRADSSEVSAWVLSLSMAVPASDASLSSPQSTVAPIAPRAAGDHSAPYRQNGRPMLDYSRLSCPLRVALLNRVSGGTADASRDFLRSVFRTPLWWK